MEQSSYLYASKANWKTVSHLLKKVAGKKATTAVASTVLQSYYRTKFYSVITDKQTKVSPKKKKKNNNLRAILHVKLSNAYVTSDCSSVVICITELLPLQELNVNKKVPHIR